MFRIFIGTIVPDSDRDGQVFTEIINAHSRANDAILIFPKRPDLYLSTHRRSGSYYNFFLPWMADQPGATQRLIRDITRNDVQLILIDDRHDIYSRGTPSRYMSDVLDFLDGNVAYVRRTVDDSIIIYTRVISSQSL